MDLFGTAGIRGNAETDVTPSLALKAGRAAGVDGSTVVVGRDGRTTGPALTAALEAGIESAGADVVRIGEVPTPTLAYASRGRRGIMVTASHNPPTDNGLKFFVDGVEYDQSAEATIAERIAADPDPVGWERWGGGRNDDPLPTYRDAVIEYTRERVGRCSDVRVAVDCGNGMASLATPQVLNRLGADVVALNANVDGHFPGRASKPTTESISDLRAFVADGAFDLGIAHDGDADRIVVVDADGDVVHEDTVLAIVAGFYTAESDADDPVTVTTPNASGRIDAHVETKGGRVERIRLGALHEGIAAAEHGGSDAAVVFAAEPWKHVHPEFGGWIDGVVSAAVFAALVARDGLDSLREPISERPYRKMSVDCPEQSKTAVMDQLERTLPDSFPDASVTTEHGVRLSFDDGAWTLVRPSGTEPYVRVYAESDAVDGLTETVVAAIEAAVDDARATE